MKNSLRALWADDSGASLVEYALIIVLLSIVAIIALKAFGNNTSSVLGTAAASL